jgi:hypothetical protein
MIATASTNRVSGANANLAAIDVLWLTGGLSCDGDTIAATAATQPSLEDLVLGTFPWVPKIRLHNPFLGYENGDEFVHFFREAAEGRVSLRSFLWSKAPFPTKKITSSWPSRTHANATCSPSPCSATTVAKFSAAVLPSFP